MTQAGNTQTRRANRLVNESSPYLLQHAYNPVDWYPWGDEARARAREENKPIFLSVGYSACHWCHVMEKESFEDDVVAALLNKHFVSIKVDREERPDIDAIYMNALQTLTGSGGWPMSVFLTPDLEPFYAGTYFPPTDRHGRPGFRRLLMQLARSWEDQPDRLVDRARELTKHLQQEAQATAEYRQTTIGRDLIAAAVADLRRSYDPAHGGFGPAPKFPSPSGITLLLRHHRNTGDAKALRMASATLSAMAEGGIYDHLGGGFHRYTVDQEWLVPHFEKMLYDNAQLAVAYLEAYQATGDAAFRRVAEETLTYVLRDMRDESGAFHASEDADSEGEEGRFYLWTRDAILDVLGGADGNLFCEWYGVRSGGNFPSHETYHAGRNILHGAVPDTPEARRMRAALLEARNKRVRPGRDDKVLAAWNGLMISAFARGHQVLGNPQFREAAEGAARFILDEMVKDGVLHRSHRRGDTRVPGYLDDYAFMVPALLDLYETTFDPAWLAAATDLADTMVARFWDEEKGGFYFAADGQDDLIVRTKPIHDGAVPSGNSAAALGLLRLSALTGDDGFRARADRVLALNPERVRAAPMGFHSLLLAADFRLNPPKEIAIVGPLASEMVRDALALIHGAYLPNKVLAAIDASAGAGNEHAEEIPLLAGKGLIDGRPAIYVCDDYVCQAPVTTVAALADALGIADGVKTQ